MRPDLGADGWQRVIRFWFGELTPQDHWQKSVALDERIRQEYGLLHQAARAGELWRWRHCIEGRLGEILLLDQFSRHIWRDCAEAFASDGMALVLAQEAVATGKAGLLPALRRAFLYMPYMHSESLAVHEEAVRLFSEPGLEENLRFELRHKAIIERFGRYPHRNAALGRESTEEEKAFLAEPGSRF